LRESETRLTLAAGTDEVGLSVIKIDRGHVWVSKRSHNLSGRFDTSYTITGMSGLGMYPLFMSCIASLQRQVLLSTAQ
jgi:hypothetical protein